jgi:osmotically-inducible protein OsmY
MTAVTFNQERGEPTMGQTDNKKTDAQIQTDVIDELKWDTRVKATAVGVEVAGGVVILTGTVDSWGARFAAKEAAHRVSGVRDVANDIQVKVPGSHERSDTDIAQAVRAALEWDVLVPHERIRTTVSRGLVTLEGKVDYWSQYDDAARAVRNLAGVRQVDNLISVEPTSPQVSPETVRGAIEGALERHAEHAAKQVRIAVTDGKVILSGEVPSWAERQAVEGAVRGTPGVRKVESEIRIHP